MSRPITAMTAYPEYPCAMSSAATVPSPAAPPPATV